MNDWARLDDFSPADLMLDHKVGPALSSLSATDGKKQVGQNNKDWNTPNYVIDLALPFAIPIS